MKSLKALGLVLLLMGGALAVGVPGLRPLAGALAICGAALLVFDWLGPRRRASEESPPAAAVVPEPAGAPPEKYQAQPGEVRLRERPSDVAVEFTSPNPGEIPGPRQNAPHEAEYTTGRGEVPAPRERERTAPEYTTPARDQPPAGPPPGSPPPGT